MGFFWTRCFFFVFLDVLSLDLRGSEGDTKGNAHTDYLHATFSSNPFQTHASEFYD